MDVSKYAVHVATALIRFWIYIQPPINKLIQSHTAAKDKNIKKLHIPCQIEHFVHTHTHTTSPDRRTDVVDTQTDRPDCVRKLYQQKHKHTQQSIMYCILIKCPKYPKLASVPPNI